MACSTSAIGVSRRIPRKELMGDRLTGWVWERSRGIADLLALDSQPSPTRRSQSEPEGAVLSLSAAPLDRWTDPLYSRTG
jgi:hypothetical protein